MAIDSSDDPDAVRVPLLSTAAPEERMDMQPDGLFGVEMEYPPYLDEGLLQELRSIHEHDVEAGQVPGAVPEDLPHADDEVFKVGGMLRMCTCARVHVSLRVNTTCTGVRVGWRIYACVKQASRA